MRTNRDGVTKVAAAPTDAQLLRAIELDAGIVALGGGEPERDSAYSWAHRMRETLHTEKTQAELRAMFHRERKDWLAIVKKRDDCELETHLLQNDAIEHFVVGEVEPRSSTGHLRRVRIYREACADCGTEVYYPGTVELDSLNVRCPKCGTEHAQQIRDAANERLRAKRAKAAGPIDKRTCEWCEEKFRPRSRAARTAYCSNACRQAAYRTRVAEAKAKAKKKRRRA